MPLPSCLYPLSTGQLAPVLVVNWNPEPIRARPRVGGGTGPGLPRKVIKMLQSSR